MPTFERSQTELLYSRTGRTSPLYAASVTSCGKAYIFRLRKPKVADHLRLECTSDSLISSAEGAEDGAAKFTSVVGARCYELD